MPKQETELIRPSYYRKSGIEAIDYITLLKAPFDIGNAIKYISRAGKKPGNTAVQDIAKAKFYIEHHIWHMNKEESYVLCDGLSTRPGEIRLADFIEAMNITDKELARAMTCIDRALRQKQQGKQAYNLFLEAEDCLYKYLHKDEPHEHD